MQQTQLPPPPVAQSEPFTSTQLLLAHWLSAVQVEPAARVTTREGLLAAVACSLDAKTTAFLVPGTSEPCLSKNPRLVVPLTHV